MAPLQRLLASDPQATKWHVILDHLTIHPSESQVAALVAEREGIAAQTLGENSQKRHPALNGKPGGVFTRPNPSGGVLLDAPSTLAFMNQVEIWLSILVRKLLKRGNFTSAFRLARPNLGVHRL